MDERRLENSRFLHKLSNKKTHNGFWHVLCNSKFTSKDIYGYHSPNLFMNYIRLHVMAPTSELPPCPDCARIMIDTNNFEEPYELQ